MATKPNSASLMHALLIAVLLLAGCAGQYGRSDRRHDDDNRRDAPASERDRHDRPSRDQGRNDGRSLNERQ